MDMFLKGMPVYLCIKNCNALVYIKTCHRARSRNYNTTVEILVQSCENCGGVNLAGMYETAGQQDVVTGGRQQQQIQKRSSSGGPAPPVFTCKESKQRFYPA
jgi:hypothetical protein